MSTTTIVVNCRAPVSKKRRVVEEVDEEVDENEEEQTIGSQDSERSEDEESTASDRKFVVDDRNLDNPGAASMVDWAEQHLRVVHSSWHSQQRHFTFLSALNQLIKSFNAVKESSNVEDLPEWYLDLFDSLQFELIKAERAVVVENRRK